MSTALIMMIAGWIIVLLVVGITIFLNKDHHPKALFLLFFAELWERFSYYGMRALLVLYMLDHFDYGDNKSYAVYAAYGAMVYATPVLGGLIAEKVLGYRKSILWGGILMALGHFAMAFESEMVFFYALGLLILGNGFFKPNISSFVGKFYSKDEPAKRDAGFTLFYQGINAGAMLAPLTCGYFGQSPDWGWHWGFGIAGVGMVIGLIVFFWGLGTGVFEEKGFSPKTIHEQNEPMSLLGKFGMNDIYVVIGTILFLPVVYFLISHTEIQFLGYDMVDFILIAVIILSLGSLVYMAFTQESKEGRDKLLVVMILFIFISTFWTFFELAGSAITVFTERNVDRLGAASSQFQAINPFFIIVFAPVFAAMWEKLELIKAEPSAPVKYAIGMLLLGLGFLLLTWGGTFASAGLVPIYFLIFAYLFHTLGELCISPIGLSLVTKLSPAKVVGLVMGVWFLSSTVAHKIGGKISKLTSSSESGVDTSTLPATETLHIYTDVFWNVGLIAIVAGVIVLLLSPLINKMMHDVK